MFLALQVPLALSETLVSASQRVKAKQSAATLPQNRPRIKISTGYEPLDQLLSGGLDRGHILELSGPPGSIKNSISMGVTSSFLQLKEHVLFIGE